MPTVSLLIATRNSAGRLPFVIKGFRPIIDEVVIGVDDTSTDGTISIAGKLADRCVPVKSGGYKATFLYKLFQHCKGEWILNIDDDEFLANGVGREYLYFLNPFKAKVFSIPRFELTHLYPKPRQLASGFSRQQRIFWNRQTYQPNFYLHSCGVKFHGPCPYIPILPTIHINLALYSTEERRKRVAYYERFGKGAGMPHITLYETMPNPPLLPFPHQLLPSELWEYWGSIS